MYISVEPRIEVGGEDVQQTTLEGGCREEFQSLHMDSYPILTPCTTVGGYTPPCQETLTPIEVCGSSYQQECIQSLGREDEDEDGVDHGRDEYEEMIGRDDFHKNIINYENVDNVHDDVVDEHDDDAIEFHDDGVQPVVPTYEAHGPSFHANTWDNIVDPSNVEIPFSLSWMWGMNFKQSGTVDLHTLLPSMRKLGGRWLKSFPYGSHLTYKSHQVKQPHSKNFP